MANKKLKVGDEELKLPAKKSKEDKKKWPGKKCGKKGKAVQVAETVEIAVETPVPEVEQPLEQLLPSDAPNTNEATEQALTEEPAETQRLEEPSLATDPEPSTKKGKKLKVKADLKPKKLSMMAAALQVLQQRKVPMTCPDLIDVLATEDLWTSPGGKTPAATLYAAISRSIKDLGKASPFRKTERGKFEAKILPKE